MTVKEIEDIIVAELRKRDQDSDNYQIWLGDWVRDITGNHEITIDGDVDLEEIAKALMKGWH